MKALALSTPLNTFLKEVDRYPILGKKDEYDLAVKYYQNGDLDAANKLVLSNLRFVIRIATEYKTYGFPLMDLIQEGTIGLMHAVKKFDPYKGYRLLSYAVWWIRARIHNHIMKFWSNVKIGTTQAQRKLFQKISSAKRKLKINSSALNNKDIEKLAEHFDVKEKDVVEMELRIASRDFSLDSKIDGDDSVNYVDYLTDERVNQEELIENLEYKKIASDGIFKGLEDLNEREKKVISKRYFSDTPRKLRELGDDFGISKERVRQIENNAIKKLRKAVVLNLNQTGTIV